MRKTALLLTASILLAAALLACVGSSASARSQSMKQITFGRGNDSEPAWSPDGSRIAFQSDRDGRMGIYILDVKSGKTMRLSTGPGWSQFPAWSPDSKNIAYSYTPSHLHNLYPLIEPS